MNIKILLFAISAAAISSCSSSYKNGQTPDDVYYSPVRVAEEDSRHDKDKDVARRLDPEERQIRMAAHDRRWRDFDDDYDYRYDPYNYGYSYGYYYNPYYCHYPVYIQNVVIANPKNTVPRMTNLGSYNNTVYAVAGTKYGSVTSTNGTRVYNNSNNNTSLIRRILSNVNNSNQSNDTRPASNNTRTYTPSSSSSSSSSGSSGSSSGSSVSRPGRGG